MAVSSIRSIGPIVEVPFRTRSGQPRIAHLAAVEANTLEPIGVIDPLTNQKLAIPDPFDSEARGDLFDRYPDAIAAYPWSEVQA